MPAAFDPSWHWRAWRAHARGSQTRQRVAQWLMSLDLQSTRLGHVARSSPSLILLGGSAGWMMSEAFLGQFQRVLLVDLDPWAGRLFRWNHRRVLGAGRTSMTFWCGDAHQTLPEVLAWDPNACVLFDNFLGLDSMYTGDLQVTEKRLRGLHVALKGRVWGSVHDRYSGPGTPNWSTASCWQTQERVLAGSAFPHERLLASVEGYGEWLDHGTDRVLPASTPTHLIAWPIITGRWHWLQAGWVGPD